MIRVVIVMVRIGIIMVRIRYKFGLLESSESREKSEYDFNLHII